MLRFPKNFKKFQKMFLDRSKKYFSEKLNIFPNIKIDAKFHSGSNGSTLNLWKSLQESASKKLYFFTLNVPESMVFGTTLWNPLYSKCHRHQEKVRKNHEKWNSSLEPVSGVFTHSKGSFARISDGFEDISSFSIFFGLVLTPNKPGLSYSPQFTL